MTKSELLESCAEKVQSLLVGAEKGHDWFHIQRVRKNVFLLQSNEGGDLFILELAALLHDIDDAKFNGGDELAGAKKARRILEELDADQSTIDEVVSLVAQCSYKGGQVDDQPKLELQILRDADRLDAIGAIGVARTFHYGGFKNQALYDPEIPVREKMTPEEYRTGKSSTINHFYEKLLKLKDGMYTETGKRLAADRHQFLEAFLDQFMSEWNGHK